MRAAREDFSPIATAIFVVIMRFESAGMARPLGSILWMPRQDDDALFISTESRSTTKLHTRHDRHEPSHRIVDLNHFAAFFLTKENDAGVLVD